MIHITTEQTTFNREVVVISGISSREAFIRNHGSNMGMVENLARKVEPLIESAEENATLNRMRNGSKRALRDVLSFNYVHIAA